MYRLFLVVVSTALLVSPFGHAEEPVGSATAAQEWRSYIEPMLTMGEHAVPLMADSSDPQLRQELYRQLFSGFSAGYMALMHADPEHPDFWPIFNMAYNYFAPNPDDSYYATPINPNGVYKISGYRGTVHIIDFQLANGPLVTRGSGGLGRVYANFDIDKLHIKRDGSFEVILSTERPAGYKGDWWKLDPAAKADPKSIYLMVREISNDWLREVDGRLAIERLDTPAIKPRPTAQEIEANLKQISMFAENWTTFSLKWLKRIEDQGLVNKVVVHDLSASGGYTIQKYIEGLYDIGADEALIYETTVPKHCRYWNIELTDRLWGAIDFINRQTHLNGHTAKLDKDGKFRAVISTTDPGVPNWLDNAGYGKGMLFGRWTDCDSLPVPAVTKVKLADVRKYLPADTPVVTAEARDAAIRLRRKGAQLRRRW
jgi:hypothetical protein